MNKRNINKKLHEKTLNKEEVKKRDWFVNVTEK